MLTGDTLFVGDVGRPDLRVALGWSANDLGGLLYDSLHDKLLTLPDAAAVYPAHGAGSLCGKALSKETVSTIGEQRRSNYALQPMSKAAFVELVTADQPDAPSYFTYDAVLNSQERPTLDETLERISALTLDQRAGAAGGGRAGARHARPGRVRRRPPGRQHQHRPRRPVRDVGRHRAEPRAADRHHRRPRARARSGDAAGAHRLRSGGRLSRGRAPQRRVAAGADGVDRARQRAGRGRARGGRAPDAAPVMVDVRTPGERQQKRIAGSVGMPLNHLARTAVGAAAPTARSSSTAPAAIARRLPRACCSATGSRRSARSPAASPPGTPDGSRWKPTHPIARRSPSARAGRRGRGRPDPRRGPRRPRRGPTAR